SRPRNSRSTTITESQPCTLPPGSNSRPLGFDASYTRPLTSNWSPSHNTSRISSVISVTISIDTSTTLSQPIDESPPRTTSPEGLLASNTSPKNSNCCPGHNCWTNCPRASGKNSRAKSTRLSQPLQPMPGKRSCPFGLEPSKIIPLKDK